MNVLSSCSHIPSTALLLLKVLRMGIQSKVYYSISFSKKLIVCEIHNDLRLQVIYAGPLHKLNHALVGCVITTHRNVCFMNNNKDCDNDIPTASNTLFPDFIATNAHWW